MRLAPVPIAFAHDPERAVRLAVESSRTSHGARTCFDACRVFAALLAGALYGASGIPAAWMERLAQREALERLADGLVALGNARG